ncbi:hypothetical protein AAFP94_14825, partial [Flavobacteriaceae bacterium MJ-SS4]
MKNSVSLVFALLISALVSSQDCTTNKNSGYSYAALNNGFIEGASSFVEPGEYMIVSNILTNDYVFTANHSVSMVEQNDYITISDTSNNILAQGVSPLSHTFSSAGTIRIHVSLNASCDTEVLNVSIALLNATVAPTTCQLPENPRVIYRSDARIDFSWDPPSIGSVPVSYDWEAVPAGGSQGAGDASGNTLTTNASAIGLTPNTSYTFFIRSNCGANGSSDWFETPSLSTNAGPPPSNDFCDDAILIVQETDVNNAASATALPGTLLNTAGTDIEAEQCSGSTVDNARDDVWYSFIAQTEDINITLDPMFDGILELLSDCNEGSIIACSDIGNGTTIEQITHNSLVVNQTYYFRVYYQGFAASNPDFTVKLWSTSAVFDSDGDSYSDATDCDDGDPAINPSATEICDGIDNNCDGQKDEGLDADTDGIADCFDICPGFNDTIDDDGDGAPNGCDTCPSDPNKTEPGDCGCGTTDTDSDGDGTPDCNDNCPSDPNKTDPGTCGCGIADTDSDSDGTPDCNDNCPSDPNKTEPGDCGCGTPDTDTDSDGTPDCNDNCPSDPNKTDPGACGCGIADTDSDSDGTPDCNDNCPSDPNKIEPGDCGCGVADTDSDGDGTLDCNDNCPSD